VRVVPFDLAPHTVGESLESRCVLPSSLSHSRRASDTVRIVADSTPQKGEAQMTKLFGAAVLLACAASALGQTLSPQQLTPPCDKPFRGIVPCIDRETGKMVLPPPPVPHQDMLPFGSGFGPCSSKTPDGLPCSDPNFGVVVPFSGPIPTERLSLPAPSGEPMAIPQAQTQGVTQSTVAHGFQYWSYQANGKCDYHDGSNVVHFDAGTLQNYASNRAQFQASFQAGQAIGSAIGVLVGAWIAHHQRVVQERNDIRQQISTYYNAAFDLNDEVIHEQDTLASDYALLETIDPPRRSIYERGAKIAAESKARLATFRPTGEKMLPELLATRDAKVLRARLDVAQKTYNVVQNGAEQEYVFLRFIGGVAGYFVYQQTAHPPPAQQPANPQ